MIRVLAATSSRRAANAMVLAFLLAGVGPAEAQWRQSDWIGQSTEWDEEDNWTNGPPDGFTHVRIESGTPPKLPDRPTVATASFFLGGPLTISVSASGDPQTLSNGLDPVRLEGGIVDVTRGATWRAYRRSDAVVASTLSHLFEINGTLNVNLGGQVLSTNSVLGTADNSGSASISGAGSRWENNGLFVGAGQSSAGLLTISNGAVVLSRAAFLAGAEGSSGTVRVRGEGSHWDLFAEAGQAQPSAILSLGNRGRAAILITEGGTVSVRNANLGSGSSGVTPLPAQAEILVSGPGSTFFAGRGAGSVSRTKVGLWSRGLLEIEHEGLARVYDLIVAESAVVTQDVPGVTTPSGTVRVSHGGRLEVERDAIFGQRGNALLAVSSGGDVAVTGTSVVGGTASGTSAIAANGGTGFVHVIGSGSVAHLGTTFVGSDGAGTILVEVGGTVRTRNLVIGGSSSATMTSPDGAVGRVRVGAGGTLACSSGIRIGNNGLSELEVSGGGVVTSVSSTTVGYHNPGVHTGQAEAIIHGFGSTWDHGGGFSISRGHLHVHSAGRMTVSNSTGNSSIGSGGRATIEGAVSQWDTRTLSFAGYLEVADGAVLNGAGFQATGTGGGKVILGERTRWTVFNLWLAGTDNLIEIGRQALVATSGSVRLAQNAGHEATVRQGAGTLRINTTGTNGYLEFGAGTSAYTIEGGRLEAHNPATGHALRAAAGATYDFELAGALIRATGPLTASVDASLRPATSTVFDTAGHTITWSGALSGQGRLVKSGYGTLNLSGTQVHEGDVLVELGTLIVGSATLGDDAEIRLATGATLHLPHGETDTVHRLVISGSTQAAGLWGGPDAVGVEHHSNRISGSGRLLVTSGLAAASPYSNWAAGHGLEGDEATPDADADGDGINNLLERALGGDPRVPRTARLPIAVLAADRVTLRFNRIADPHLLYEIWASDDLNNWGDAPVWWSTGADNVEGEVVVTDVNKLLAPGRGFIRLTVRAF